MPGQCGRPIIRAMNANADRFPLLRFVGWFAGLLLAATALAMLIAQSEVEAGPRPMTDAGPPAQVPAVTPAVTPVEVPILAPAARADGAT